MGAELLNHQLFWGAVSRTALITVAASVYANGLTDKLVKGMLTGPVTIFNWSFPREDIERKEVVTQIALALRDEVLDLEKHEIKIIQIDEPALRENLPLRKSDWFSQYLDWAVPAFRLVHSVSRQQHKFTLICAIASSQIFSKQSMTWMPM
ncbi:Methionine synthase II (cobalamin-independent) (MetE) [Fructobacillus cardui]|nr:Methionine synthase II (cobalamin-independent) (MetE) [Fructobacillus cardui]